jgi:hypothetical protein
MTFRTQTRRPSARALGLAIATATFGWAAQAHAIDCRDGYQRVQGNLIATPYCQDQYLAVVARQFGVKASADQIRNNPSYKREICRLVGRDIRVQNTCVDENSPRGGGRF